MILVLGWVMAILIIFALFIVNLLTMTSTRSQLKASTYECGFSPKYSSRLPFSLRFFLMALLFLIFDVELVLVVILPLLYLTPAVLFTVLFFCVFLFLGLLHEWNEGSLSWVN